MFGAGDPLGRLPASRRGGKAAEAGLAQADRERIADLAHGVDDLIDRNAARDAGDGHVRRAHGIDRTNDIALDTRYLDQARDRVTHQTEQIATSSRNG